MYVIVLGIFLLKLQISVSDPEFPVHLDLQKVGEAIFNNEKLNILKTTSHVITDHFKEFMLRGASNNPSGKKIFIDKNGFRHEWSGFGERTESLRTTDLINVGSESFINASESETISTNVKVNTTDTVEDTSNENLTSKDSDENNEHEENNNASYINETVQNVTKEDNATDGEETATTFNLISATQIKNSGIKSTIDKRLRQGDEEKKEKPNDTGKAETKERTVMLTTFFCPYLGIITMSGFADDIKH